MKTGGKAIAVDAYCLQKLFRLDVSNGISHQQIDAAFFGDAAV